MHDSLPSLGGRKTDVLCDTRQLLQPFGDDMMSKMIAAYVSALARIIAKMPQIDKFGLGYWRYVQVQRLQSIGKFGKPARPYHIDAIIASTHLPHDARILCLGARNKNEPDEWFRRGYERVVAVDLLPSPGVRFADMNRRLPFDDGAFDLLYASHSLVEHSWNLSRALTEACRVVRLGGLLFAAFPVAFKTNSHDRVDVGNADGFLERLRSAQPRPVRPLWVGGTVPGDVAVLVALGPSGP